MQQSYLCVPKSISNFNFMIFVNRHCCKNSHVPSSQRERERAAAGSRPECSQSPDGVGWWLVTVLALSSDAGLVESCRPCRVHIKPCFASFPSHERLPRFHVETHFPCPQKIRKYTGYVHTNRVSAAPLYFLCSSSPHKKTPRTRTTLTLSTGVSKLVLAVPSAMRQHD